MNGWTNPQLLEQVLVAPRSAFPRWSGTEVIERPGWLQIITPSFQQGSLNEVVHAELDEHEADAAIDAVIEQYRRLGLRFRWDVKPGCQPGDLGQRLARRGLTPTEVVGMACSTASLARTDSAAIEIVEVDASTIAGYERVMAEGWGVDATPFEPLHRAVLDDPERRQALFLARWEGEPAGVAGSVMLDRSVYLLGAVVLDRFRGRGVYRALVAERMRHAAARGRSLAVVHAMASSSAPLLDRLGFTTVVHFTSYRGP